MKKITFTLGVCVMLIASAFTVIESVNWKIKEDSYSVKFKGGKVEGIFKGLKSTIMFNAVNPEKSKISATIDVSTINTGNGMMNKHAQSDEALNVKQYPQITFESASVTKKGSSYEAAGKLTMKGVTKDILLPFTFEDKGQEGIFKATFSVIPKDYNITKSGTPDKLDIELIVPVTK